MQGQHVFLVDGSGYIFRAYHALPPLTRKSDGLPVGAVAGFCNMLWKLLREMPKDNKPTHLAIVFDKKNGCLAVHKRGFCANRASAARRETRCYMPLQRRHGPLTGPAHLHVRQGPTVEGMT